MTTTDSDFDLRVHPPRPAREKLGGLIFLPRTIDKVRAKLAGTMGPFKIGPGMSKILFDYLGITEEDFTNAVRAGKTDEEVLAWVRAHSDPSKYEWISSELENRTFRDASHRAEMESRYPAIRGRADVTTIFEMLDVDDPITYENAKRFGGFGARLVRFSDASGRIGTGLADGNSVRRFPDAIGDLAQFIALDEGARAAEIAKLGEERIPLSDVKLKAPLHPPKNIFCIGRNYLGHAEEGARARGETLVLPAVPTIFTKAPTAIADPDEVLELQARLSNQYDFEAELAVVIGTRCRDVAEENALDVVFGYTCINDVTARDMQKATTQWFKGKTLDHTCPMGPWIVPKEAFDDPQSVAVKMRINGVEKQSAPTSTMIFSVRRIIAELSAGCTLEPGDVIATGTPEGVGFARTPPEFLKDGDVMEVDIERIGVLRNVVRIR